MLFLNPWLLLGLAGVSIPILIHLVRQQAAKPIEWGAMRFLFDTISVRRRKMEWEDLLLMAARCLLLALAALAIARPFVTPDSVVPWLFVLPAALLGIALLGASFVLTGIKARWLMRTLAFAILLIAGGLVLFEKYTNLKRFEATGRRDVALVIDGSTSMQLRRDGKTMFEIAIGEAKRVINESPRGTAFTVVLGGPAPQAVTSAPLTHRADVLDVIGKLAPVGGTFRAYEALGMATLALSEGMNASKEIIVLTDSQRVGWRLENPGMWRTLEKTWNSMPTSPKLILRNLGAPSGFQNAALSDFEISRQVIGTDREVTLRAVVRNTGEKVVTPGPVSLEIGGAKVAEDSVGLLVPGQTATVEFRHRFKEAGPKLVQLRIDAEDDLEEDNKLAQIVSVRSKLPVLLVEGNPSGSFFEKASGYSALALAPSQAVLGGKASGKSFLMDPRVVNAASLTEEDLESASVVILADVQRLPAALAEAISRKVAGGMGLITIAGPRAEPSFYNVWNGPDGFVIPLEIGEETIDPQGISPAVSTFDHEALAIFSVGGDLEEAKITRWRKTKTREKESTQAAALTNGDALIAARIYGKGRTLLVTTALDARAGGLPAKRSFVPFVHELTTWAAGWGADLNVKASWNPSIELAGNSGGLTGEYFRGENDRRKDVSRERFDSVIDFDWGSGSPMKGLPNDRFFVHWSGRIIAPKSGEYLFSAEVDDNLSVKISGTPEMRARDGEGDMGTVFMKADVPVDIAIAYSENYGEAKVRLFWTAPGGKKEIIPSSAFIPRDSGKRGTLQVIDPRGSQRIGTVSRGRRGEILTIDGAAIPGVYMVAINEDLQGRFPEITDGFLPLVVSRDTGESVFEKMDEDDLELIRSATDLVLPSSVKDILAIMEGKGFGREIWKILAIAALILIFLEAILARWVSRSRRLADDVRVDFGEETSFRGGFR